jgi:hypothetical protein
VIELKNLLILCLVFLSSVLLVSAISDASDVTSTSDDSFVECKTVWHDEESRWLTLCGEDIKKIDEYKRSKVAEVGITDSIVDGASVDDTQHSIVEEIFNDVEEGFGIVPEDKTILKDVAPIKKVQLENKIPKKVVVRKEPTLIDVIVERIDDFISSPFRFFGFGREENVIEESYETESWTLDSGSHSADVPQEFLDMLEFEPERIYYIAQSEQGASDDNNCLYPQHISGFDGPCETLNAMKKYELIAGEAIAVGKGTYVLGENGISVKFPGTADKPIRIFAYDGEEVILESRNPNGKIYFGGSYTTLEGFDIRCYIPVCMTVWDANIANNLIVYNNKISEAYEDGIKTTTESENVLIYRNEFFNIAGEGESIDAFGVSGAWIIQNEFYDDVFNVRDSGAVSWSKGGASDIYYVDNYFHDLNVRNHALILGGCCWNNWDGVAGVDPVATNVHAIRNVFERITIDGDYRYKGAIGVEGCHNCEVIDNSLIDVDVAIGVHATIDGNERVGSKNTLISGNFEENVVSERVLNLHEDSKEGLVIDGNEYCVENPTVHYTEDMTLEEFQIYGFEASYEPCEGSNTIGITPAEEREFIEKETLGDKEFEMNVYTDQIVKDVQGLTQGFGAVTHSWLHPKFLDAYINEVGAEGTTIRIGHSFEQNGRGFPQTRVHRELLKNGAKVMVTIKGIPAEEGIAYCSEYSGSDCILYEHSGPAKNIQGWKDYVKDVTTFYNSKGVKYFIIWNEPNYEVKNWKEVCRSPNDCWDPTMEEFVDLTVAGVEAVYEVDPTNEVGVDATSSFFGKLYFENGSEAYVPIEIFEALEANGLEANHHFHHYNPDPFTMTYGDETEQAIEYWRANTDAYVGSNLDEFSDGLPGRGSINGDGIYAVSSTMALIANTVNYDIDHMGWFQIYSNVHEPGTIQGRFLEWNENMIDKSGIYKPVFWLSKLLHEAPGTLLVEDDLDESDTVRAFTVRNQEGTGYCWYGVNFDMDKQESVTIKLTAKNLPTNVNHWLYTTYKIGREDGNPYHDDVEPEIELLLQPMIDEIKGTSGATWNDYIDEAWPIISEINSWESVRPTKEERVISGNKAELSTQVTLEHEEVRVICLEKTELA